MTQMRLLYVLKALAYIYENFDTPDASTHFTTFRSLKAGDSWFTDQP